MMNQQAIKNTPSHIQEQGEQTSLHLLTVNQFSKKHQAFSQASLRSMIFNERTNGMKKHGAVMRVGRKVLINEPGFFDWIKAQNNVAS